MLHYQIVVRTSHGKTKNSHTQIINLKSWLRGRLRNRLNIRFLIL